MVFNGVGNVIGQAVVARIVAPHDALQLWKLAHHVGQQIGFGQLCGGVCSLRQRVATEGLAQGFGNAAHACHALTLCAQFVVVHDLVQTFHARCQCFLAILIEEKLGIGQARAHHALVATNHRTGIGWRNVADDQELVRELAFCREQWEVFLIGFHGQDQTLLRHFQKLFFKFAGEHIGALNQGRDFIQQGFVFNGFGTAAHFGGCRIKLTHNFCTALSKAGNDGTIARQSSGITVGVLNDDRRHTGFKAMAVCLLTGSQAQCFDRDHVFAVQSHQTVRRPYKVNAGPAGHVAVCFQLIGHDFGNRQLGQAFVQGFLQTLQQVRTFGHAVVKQSVGFAIGRAFQCSHHRSRIADVCTKCLQLFEQGGRGIAAGIEANGHWHQLLLNGFIGGLCGHLRDMRGQSTWRGVGCHHRLCGG